MRDIIRTHVYDHPIETVWKAVATAEGLESWLMPNTFEPYEGHTFTFTSKPYPGFDGVVHSVVRTIEPPRRLEFTWVGGPLESVVSFVLTDEAANRTRLRFSHTGFEGAAQAISRVALGLGWRRLLGRRLPRTLAITDQRN